MTSLRRFTAHDLLSFNNVNLDYFTETVRGWSCVQQHHQAQFLSPPPPPLPPETAAARNRCRPAASATHRRCCPAPPPVPRLQYNLNFYLDYLAKWPEYCQMAEGPGKQAMGYSECVYGVLARWWGVGRGTHPRKPARLPPRPPLA